MFYVNTNSKGNQIKTKRYKFSLVSDTDVEKSCFSCEVKSPYQQFLTLLNFAKIFRSSRLQMFFKIDALKILQYSDLKRVSNTGVFL